MALLVRAQTRAFLQRCSPFGECCVRRQNSSIGEPAARVYIENVVFNDDGANRLPRFQFRKKEEFVVLK